MYAVWHSGFMQKMAAYQIQQLKFFAGFFVPSLTKKQKDLVQQAKLSQNKKQKDIITKKKFKVNIAILGGGDVVFPLILAGTVLINWGLLPALIVTLGSTIALSLLLIYGKKKKPYPAMPYISTGAFAGLALAYLIP